MMNYQWAEAISVNEQRVVPTTSIECGGNIITVNGQKIGSPFVIKAIGLPENLANLNRAGGYLSYMKSASIGVDLKKSNNITIPKYLLFTIFLFFFYTFRIFIIYNSWIFRYRYIIRFFQINTYTCTFHIW